MPALEHVIKSMVLTRKATRSHKVENMETMEVAADSAPNSIEVHGTNAHNNLHDILQYFLTATSSQCNPIMKRVTYY